MSGAADSLVIENCCGSQISPANRSGCGWLAHCVDRKVAALFKCLVLAVSVCLVSILPSSAADAAEVDGPKSAVDRIVEVLEGPAGLVVRQQLNVPIPEEISLTIAPGPTPTASTLVNGLQRSLFVEGFDSTSQLLLGSSAYRSLVDQLVIVLSNPLTAAEVDAIAATSTGPTDPACQVATAYALWRFGVFVADPSAENAMEFIFASLIAVLACGPGGGSAGQDPRSGLPPTRSDGVKGEPCPLQGME